MNAQSGVRDGVAAEVKRVDLAEWQADAPRWRGARWPVVIAGGFADSVAVTTWTLETIADRYPDVEVHAQCAPSETGERRPPGWGAMTMAQFVSLLRGGRRCGLKQQQLTRTPTLSAELDIPRAIAPPYRAVNLWIGNGTRSPLHFDRAENLFVQVHGEKRFILEPPSSPARLYMRQGDLTHFSLVDPLAPDAGRFPDYHPGQQQVALMAAGDALYIPPGWFHDVTALGTVISANCWFGEELGDR